MPEVNSLYVHSFCPLLFDAHSPVDLKLNLNVIKENANNQSMEGHKRLWDASKADEYKASFDQKNVDELMQRVLELENRDHVQQCDMDTIVESLNSLFIVAAEETFWSTYKPKHSPGKTYKPTWYGYNCKKMRRKWHSA